MDEVAIPAALLRATLREIAGIGDDEVSTSSDAVIIDSALAVVRELGRELAAARETIAALRAQPVSVRISEAELRSRVSALDAAAVLRADALRPVCADGGV